MLSFAFCFFLPRLHIYKMSGQSSRTERLLKQDQASTEGEALANPPLAKSIIAQLWPQSFHWHFHFSLIPWCKNMKTQLCGIYRQCFLLESGPANVPRHLSPGLQERAQTMVQCVSRCHRYIFLLFNYSTFSVSWMNCVSYILVTLSETHWWTGRTSCWWKARGISPWCHILAAKQLL